MLSGPAILRVSVLLIIAGILAAVVQFLLPSAGPGLGTQSAPPPAPSQVNEPPPVVQPAPPPSSPVPAERSREPAAPSGTGATTQAAPHRMPSDALAFPSDPAAQQDAQTQAQAQPQPQGQEAAGQAEVERAEDGAGPRALAVVDLNTASVADLNRLRGGGTIGRAIVAKRPYTSVDQLLSKRVLSRAVYQRIKDQVTVR
ncbi:helix-hairpin-helix domain-containing protein [Methylobacterium mesophilicum SR1.6/6]|uniref:Helix-hairpin-helix domain-containing protein n=2 Tax=Methylobacterium mesophilicum TaxID=39956 RepID=A0A6B9FWL7_9HYPH|nr:helix-hairpin-helix domain-containing protein [Methylobacterium mesophilicum]QGY05075.1 helix-hairpin-helix domain-containing protein [Methylobacterium mesophilicum SR1.6/6]